MYGRHWVVQQFVVQVDDGLQPAGKKMPLVESFAIGAKPGAVVGRISTASEPPPLFARPVVATVAWIFVVDGTPVIVHVPL